jgi:hypothetical protein
MHGLAAVLKMMYASKTWVMKHFYYFVLEKFSDLNVFFNESQHEIIFYVVCTAIPF